MTTPRALVGVWNLIAVIGVIGIVLSAPVVWTIVLGIAATYQETHIQGRPHQPKAELVQKKVLPPTMTVSDQK